MEAPGTGGFWPNGGTTKRRLRLPRSPSSRSSRPTRLPLTRTPCRAR
jgi:hypothetical protein